MYADYFFKFQILPVFKFFSLDRAMQSSGDDEQRSPAIYATRLPLASEECFALKISVKLLGEFHPHIVEDISFYLVGVNIIGHNGLKFASLFQMLYT